MNGEESSSYSLTCGGAGGPGRAGGPGGFGSPSEPGGFGGPGGPGGFGSPGGPGGPGGFGGPGGAGGPRGFGGAGGPGGFGSPGGAAGQGGFSSSGAADGPGGFGGAGAIGTINATEAQKWKQDAQYAFNKPKQINLLRDWLGFRQIDLSGAEYIINSTDQSNECEAARLLIQQCTADKAKIKAGFRNHMQMDNWISVFGK